MNEKKSVVSDEWYYQDQMKILWELHHPVDELEYVWGKEGR